MQEEAKRFEKDTPTDHPDYFMQQRRANPKGITNITCYNLI